jgi:hypothetical protein
MSQQLNLGLDDVVLSGNSLVDDLMKDLLGSQTVLGLDVGNGVVAGEAWGAAPFEPENRHIIDASDYVDGLESGVPREILAANLAHGLREAWYGQANNTSYWGDPATGDGSAHKQGEAEETKHLSNWKITGESRSRGFAEKLYSGENGSRSLTMRNGSFRWERP